MAQGKYLSLEEARKTGKLKRFCKEHQTEGDAERFGDLLDAMARGETPRSSGSDGGTSKRG